MTEKFYNKDDEDKKRPGVYEARKLIDPNSYDDDWNSTRYTSELRNEKDDSFYAFVDFEGDEVSIRECPHCLEYGFHYTLGPKIKKKNESPAPDDDQFLSCYQCGNTFGIHETFQEAKIKDSLETVQNPFEGNESTFFSIDSRVTQRKKGIKPKNRRLKSQEQEDAEIQAEINKRNIVNILHDSSR